jgi:Hypothetical protein (DUF2513)
LRRELDLVREILLKIESDPRFDGQFVPANAATLGISKYSEIEICYNCRLLIEAGLLSGNVKMAQHGVVLIASIKWTATTF